MYTLTHPPTHPHTHPPTHPHTHTHTNTRARARTHTHTLFIYICRWLEVVPQCSVRHIYGAQGGAARRLCGSPQTILPAWDRPALVLARASAEYSRARIGRFRPPALTRHQYMMSSTENVITVSSASHDCSFWLTSRSRDGRRAWTRTLRSEPGSA
jgi:hypothetical protein